MDRKKIKKLTSPRYYLIGIGVLFFVLALISSLLPITSKDNGNKKPISYASIANTASDKEGQYVYLDVTGLYQFAVRELSTGDEEYYYATDKDVYLYIVCIDAKTFNKLEQLYLNDPDNFSYRLEGYLYDFSGDIRHLAKEMIPEVFGTDWGYLVDEFDDYFLSTYLDTLNNPNVVSGGNMLVSVLLLLFGAGFFASGVVRILRVGKYKQDKAYSSMISELEDPSIWNIESLKLALTKNYLVHYGSKFGFVDYKDITDLVSDNNRLVVVTAGGVVNVGKCSDSLYHDIQSFVEKKKNIFDINEI